MPNTDIRPAKRRGRPVTPAVDRFRAKVEVRGADECWPWIGGLANGYPFFRVDNTTRMPAAKFAALLAFGSPCPAGMETQHTCSTPLTPVCCNPAHLRYGEPGRSPATVAAAVRRRGDANPRAKLTDQQVADIRRRRARERPSALAREYGVSQHHIWCITAGRRRPPRQETARESNLQPGRTS